MGSESWGAMGLLLQPEGTAWHPRPRSCCSSTRSENLGLDFATHPPTSSSRISPHLCAGPVVATQRKRTGSVALGPMLWLLEFLAARVPEVLLA